jgi:hypothetical protein
MLADRFGGGPLCYDDYPVDRRQWYLNLLAIEGEVAEAYQGLGPEDELHGYGPDGYED